MTVATGNFAELLWPGIADLWGKDYNDYSPLYTQVAEIANSDKAFEKYQGVTGLPLASIKSQGNTIPYVDPYQGLQKEFVHTTYAIGSSVTREMFEDDQYNYINKIPGMLSRSMRQTEETTLFNNLNRAFNTSFTGADGLSLCNASHTLVGGGTYRNQLATASDLTQTSLETALQDIMDFVDDQSLKIRVMPRTLVVPTSISIRARKILESAGVTGSADNDKNVIQGALKIVVSPYLTDTDAWFVVTDVPHGLMFVWRRKPDLERDNDFNTKNLLFSSTGRWDTGWVDPRGIFGTAGA